MSDPQGAEGGEAVPVSSAGPIAAVTVAVPSSTYRSLAERNTPSMLQYAAPRRSFDRSQSSSSSSSPAWSWSRWKALCRVVLPRVVLESASFREEPVWAVCTMTADTHRIAAVVGIFLVHRTTIADNRRIAAVHRTTVAGNRRTAVADIHRVDRYRSVARFRLSPPSDLGDVHWRSPRFEREDCSPCPLV